jgi:hypothetical protein
MTYGIDLQEGNVAWTLTAPHAWLNRVTLGRVPLTRVIAPAAITPANDEMTRLSKAVRRARRVGVMVSLQSGRVVLLTPRGALHTYPS